MNTCNAASATWCEWGRSTWWYVLILLLFRVWSFQTYDSQNLKWFILLWFIHLYTYLYFDHRKLIKEEYFKSHKRLKTDLFSLFRKSVSGMTQFYALPIFYFRWSLVLLGSFMRWLDNGPWTIELCSNYHKCHKLGNQQTWNLSLVTCTCLDMKIMHTFFPHQPW